MAGGTFYKTFTFTCVLIAILVIYSVLTINVFNLIYNGQPKPFLDEVFHVPQAIRYCNGSFNEWDPKITTLPGLYLLSVGILKPISWFFYRDLCTVYGLRFINFLCSVVNFMIIYSLRSSLSKSEKNQRWKVLLSSLNIAIFPVLYFFTFLYYTDSISTLLILLMYRLYIDESYYISAFVGGISVICRQTNIVWVAFFALKNGLDSLQNHILKVNKKHGVAENWKCLLSSLWKTPKIHYPLLKDLMKKESGFVLVMLSFVLFVFINKGIVVGDRLAHQAAVHIPQLLYFYGFVTFFCFPYVIVISMKFRKFIYENRNFSVGLILVLIIVIALNTLVHPYLIADNRHYTFYVWKRLFERHWAIRYFVAPIYFFGAFCVNSFISHKRYSLQIAFHLCLIVSLIPQKLLEFRYFILPFLILRMNMKVEKWWQLIFESCMYVMINVFTIYIFMTKTFYWEDSDEIQRIMW